MSSIISKYNVIFFKSLTLPTHAQHSTNSLLHRILERKFASHVHFWNPLCYILFMQFHSHTFATQDIFICGPAAPKDVARGLLTSFAYENHTHFVQLECIFFGLSLELVFAWKGISVHLEMQWPPHHITLMHYKKDAISKIPGNSSDIWCGWIATNYLTIKSSSS